MKGSPAYSPRRNQGKVGNWGGARSQVKYTGVIPSPPPTPSPPAPTSHPPSSITGTFFHYLAFGDLAVLQLGWERPHLRFRSGNACGEGHSRSRGGLMRTWVFQGNPEDFDIDGYLGSRPAQVVWLVTWYASEIAIGDRVYPHIHMHSQPRDANGGRLA